MCTSIFIQAYKPYNCEYGKSERNTPLKAMWYGTVYCAFVVSVADIRDSAACPPLIQVTEQCDER